MALLVAAVLAPLLLAGYAATAGATERAPATTVAEAQSRPPVGIARAGRDRDPGSASSGDIRLVDYDPANRRAVLGVPRRNGRGIAAPAAGAIRTGDVIASAPTSAAPHGALFKVGAASRTRQGLAVSTAPATVRELLGDATVQTRVPAARLAMRARPLSPGVTTVRRTDLARTPGPSRAATASDAGLMLKLDIPLSGPGISRTSQGGPRVAGWVRVAPELIFSYGQPRRAALGVAGTYEYGYQLHAKFQGRADTGKKPLRIPFAEIHVHTVVWVGPLPVVIDADLTYFYRITAAGALSIDLEQRTRGEFAFGGRHDARAGWVPLQHHKTSTTKGKRDQVRGSGSVTAAIGAELAVYLYGTVGLTGQLAPFVRGTVQATGTAQPRWTLHAGFDLTGAFSLRLVIFGFPVLRYDVAFPPLHREWLIAGSPPARRSLALAA